MLAVVAVLALPAPALAHDQLVGSAPADGEVVAGSPTQIVLTFSAAVLEIAPAILVRDSAGSTVLETVPLVEGADVRARLPLPLGPGAYSVSWRVVSQDGHPIEGTVSFTVAGAAGTAADDAAPADDDAAPAGSADDPTAQPDADDPAAQAAPSRAVPPAAVVALTLGVLATAGAVAILLLRRRRDIPPR